VNRRLFRSLALLIGVLFVASGVGAAVSARGPSAPAASQSRALQLGLYDDAELFGHPSRGFAALKQLRVPIVRATLRWGGGSIAVAKSRPDEATDPDDPAYDWGPFDELLKRADAANAKVVAAIVGTPIWANGGRRPFFAPKNVADLRAFAKAAATRYSGDFVPAGKEDPLPAVRNYLAWNEPNNPVFLRPQFKKVGKKYVVQSAINYAKICNAIYAGVHDAVGQKAKVACGVTAPRGNNQARSSRPSVTPLVFLAAMKKRGARFDAYAHHPYYGNPSETPATRPPAKTAVTLGNIGDLLSLLKRLYGPSKHLWITEYGYQTRPPDRSFGVSFQKQAKYLQQAYTIARKNKRIDMLLWFLLRDERRIPNGWQSGLQTASGKRKPAFKTFARLER